MEAKVDPSFQPKGFMTNGHEPVGASEDGRQSVDVSGLAFKIVLLAIALGIAYFLIKPVWDDLFRSLPTAPAPGTKTKDADPQLDEKLGPGTLFD